MIKRYNCEIPNCDYQTNHRHKIHNHHIIPKEAGGTNKIHNRLYLCPNCHSAIYSKYAKKGIHSIKSDLEILAWKNNRTILEYIINNEHKYHSTI